MKADSPAAAQLPARAANRGHRASSGFFLQVRLPRSNCSDEHYMTIVNEANRAPRSREPPRRGLPFPA
jgi:hypothetical protein